MSEFTSPLTHECICGASIKEVYEPAGWWRCREVWVDAEGDTRCYPDDNVTHEPYEVTTLIGGTDAV